MSDPPRADAPSAADGPAPVGSAPAGPTPAGPAPVDARREPVDGREPAAGAPSRRSWIAFVVVVVVVLAAVALVATAHWRRGSVLLGVACGIAALARAVLPSRAVGVLAVRSRAFDVAFAAVCAAGLVVLAVGLG